MKTTCDYVLTSLIPGPWSTVWQRDTQAKCKHTAVQRQPLVSSFVCRPKFQGVGLWLKAFDMNHTVLIPGEKGQCRQQAEQTGDPNQGRTPQSLTAQEGHLSWLHRGKGGHF